MLGQENQGLVARRTEEYNDLEDKATSSPEKEQVRQRIKIEGLAGRSMETQVQDASVVQRVLVEFASSERIAIRSKNSKIMLALVDYRNEHEVYDFDEALKVARAVCLDILKVKEESQQRALSSAVGVAGSNNHRRVAGSAMPYAGQPAAVHVPDGIQNQASRKTPCDQAKEWCVIL